MRLLLLPIAMLLLLAPPGRGDEGDERIREFLRFYKSSSSVAERIEAIHVLARSNKVEAVEALLEAFEDQDFSVRRAAIEVVGGYRDPACAEYLVAKIVANKRESNVMRKTAAMEALARMRFEPAAGPIAALLEDRDKEIQRAAMLALGSLRTKDAVAGIIKRLGDRDPTLRIAALDALGQIGDPVANPAVLECLGDDRWQVRASAITALARLRSKESIQPLIDRLRIEDGRLRDDLRRGLHSLTTFDLGIDPAKWQTAWDRVKDRFEVPSEAELERAREAFEKAQAQYQEQPGDFIGIPTRSRRILYVIDISGSMEDPLLDKSRFRDLEGRTYSTFVKMEVVKEELIRTIESLDDTVFFNVLAFATEVKPWKKSGLVQAHVLSRKSAADWVRRLKPIGGASQSLKKKAGLAAAAAAGLGKTNTHAALATALDAKAAESGYDTNLGSAVDTIYFLSDGDPTAGEITEIGPLLAEVRRINLLRKITIHTINIGNNPRGKIFLDALARENGGVFLDMGE